MLLPDDVHRRRLAGVDDPVLVHVGQTVTTSVPAVPLLYENVASPDASVVPLPDVADGVPVLATVKVIGMCSSSSPFAPVTDAVTVVEDPHGSGLGLAAAVTA